MTTKYTFFLPVQPVQVCILPVQRTGGLVSGLAYAHSEGDRQAYICLWEALRETDK